MMVHREFINYGRVGLSVVFPVVTVLLVALFASFPPDATALTSLDYECPDNNWYDYCPSSPEIENYAVGVVGAARSIFVANSNTSSSRKWFMEYDCLTDTWHQRATPAPPFKNAVAMAWDPDDAYIYALPGSAYSQPGDNHGFWRYNITFDFWEELPSTQGVAPEGQGAGDAMTHVPRFAWEEVGPGFIYCFIGHRTKDCVFAAYDILAGAWHPLCMPPCWDAAKTDDGASLAWAGDRYLYALQGEADEYDPNYNFARYDLVDSTWTALSDIPAEPWGDASGGVGDGGSLVWGGGSLSDFLFALSGNQAFPESPPLLDRRFYCYSITSDAWGTMADSLPAGVGDQNGPRLGFANDNIYCWRACEDDGSLYVNYFDLHIIARLSLDKDHYHQGENFNIGIHVANSGEINSNGLDIVLKVILPSGGTQILKTMTDFVLRSDFRRDIPYNRTIPPIAPSGVYEIVIEIREHDSGQFVCRDRRLFEVD